MTGEGKIGARGERGEALPIAILFVGVFFTILVGIHIVLVAVARTAVQAAADRALIAAQVAGTGDQDCDPHRSGDETVRECEGILAARVALAGARSSVAETRTPYIVVDDERGVVTAFVYGGTVTPVLGVVELTARACGPLDDVGAVNLSNPDIWRC